MAPFYVNLFSNNIYRLDQKQLSPTEMNESKVIMLSNQELQNLPNKFQRANNTKASA